MTYALEEHLYFECLEFEMHFPMREDKKKRSIMVVRLQDQSTKVMQTYNFIVVYSSV